MQSLPHFKVHFLKFLPQVEWKFEKIFFKVSVLSLAEKHLGLISSDVLDLGIV